MISAIAAIQIPGRGLGYQGDLLYRIKEDIEHFKALTRNKPIIMGRKTWESIPEKFRPLKGRINIIVTRQGKYDAPGAIVVPSLEKAFDVAENTGADESFIFGGAELYAQALPYTNRLYLTLIAGEKPADVFFPSFEEEFEEVEKVQGETQQYSFVTFERKKDPRV